VGHGAQLVSAGEDPEAIVWDVATGRPLRKLGPHPSPIHALAVSADGTLVATAAADEVRVWTLDGTLVQTLADRAAEITAIAFSPDGTEVDGGTGDGTVIRWDRVTTRPSVLYRVPTAVTALAFSPRTGGLVVAGANHVDIHIGASQIPLENPGEVHGAVFTSDGSRVVTAGDDGAKIWDAATGKLLATRDARGSSLQALAVHDDTLWLAASDGAVSAWDVRRDMHSPDELASFVRDNDPWSLDDHDVLVLGREGSHEQR
jgi:hypothetical protein